MKNKVNEILRKAGLSAALTAGLLSVSNIEIPWFPVTMTVQSYSHSQPAKKQQWVAQSKTANKNDTSPEAQLRALMSHDDLSDENPFLTLSAPDVLEGVFASGIKTFERQALRSSSYRSEVGYDQVHYTIVHTDGKRSHVLAYIERTMEEENDASVVMILREGEQDWKSSIFRSDALAEVANMPATDADSLLTERLRTGVPFLSVSR